MAGIKHPDRFASICSHSSGMLHVSDDWWALLSDPDDADVVVQATRLKSRAKPGGSQLVIAFDRGREDFTLDGNRDLHAHMEKIGLPHTYKEHAGAHTREYWPRALPQVSGTASEIESMAAD